MDIECPICCEEDDVNIIQTECGHMFHEGCIERYIAYNKKKRLINCPVCRSVLLENIEAPSQLIQAPQQSSNDNEPKKICLLLACMLLASLLLLLVLL